MLCRPCVDCGRLTGCWCSHCHAKDRIPTEQRAPGQHTPLCTFCDDKRRACHFCLRTAWCRPDVHGEPLPVRAQLGRCPFQHRPPNAGASTGATYSEGSTGVAPPYGADDRWGLPNGVYTRSKMTQAQVQQQSAQEEESYSGSQTPEDLPPLTDPSSDEPPQDQSSGEEDDLERAHDLWERLYGLTARNGRNYSQTPAEDRVVIEYD